MVAAGAIGATTVAVILASSTTAGAEVISSSDSGEFSKSPATLELQLQQFDPALGTLTKVTVTSTLEGDASGSVENLGSAPEVATLSFDASSSLDGPVSEPLDLSITDSVELTLAGKQRTSFSLSAADDAVTSSTAPADLALFTGTGQVDYTLSGEVWVIVAGKANWHHDGGSRARATVKVEYEYTPTGGSTTTTQPSTTSTTTPATTTTVPATTTTLPATTTTLPPTTTSTTTTLPPTTTTLPPTTTTTPDEEPEGCPPSYWGQSGAPWSGYNGGDSFNAVFGLSDPPHADISLADALNAGGLRSNATAALLNASHPDIDGFPYTAGDVIALTADALNSGTGIDALAAQFAAANNAVCPL